MEFVFAFTGTAKGMMGCEGGRSLRATKILKNQEIVAETMCVH